MPRSFVLRPLRLGPVRSGAPVAVIALACVLVLGACGGGGSEGTTASSPPGTTSAAPPDSVPPVSETAGSDDDSSPDTGAQEGPWPCSLIPTASVEGLVEDPTLDDSQADQLNAPTCTWDSQTADGDLFTLQFDTLKTVLDAARNLGTPVGDLGDEAFYQQTRMNVGSNLDRAVVQTRLFITFGEERVLLLLRSQDAFLPQDLIAVGRALLGQCQSSGCAKPKAPVAATKAAACGLLTASDLASAGLTVDEGETPGDKPASCAWTAGNAEKPSFFVHEQDKDFAFFQKNQYYEPVAGVGKGALVGATTIYFHNGGPVYSVVCAKGCTMSKDQLISVAKVAAGRL